MSLDTKYADGRSGTEELLSSTEVIRRLDGRLSYRQLDYWVRVGRISPSVAEADGTGTGRVWSAADVAALSGIMEVLDRQRQELADLRSGTMWAELHAKKPADSGSLM